MTFQTFSGDRGGADGPCATPAARPAVVLLDEATSHLDFHNEALVLAIVARLAVQGLAARTWPGSQSILQPDQTV
jgi:alpha-D-ribose 1-methylphosphonate 5-triphosphate synthase subunit PhnL